jgi:glutamyl-tRNA reductase
LPDLNEREQKIVRKLAKSMVNQMLRDPILRIKELAAGERGRETLKLFVELFALAPYLEPPGEQTTESDSREMIGGGLR